MAVTVLSFFPQTFIAGSTILVSQQYSNYPTSGWTAKAWFTLQGSGATPTGVDATISDSAFLFTLSNTFTATLKPGVYDVSVVVTDGTQREVPFCGRNVTYITPDPTQAVALSEAEQMLIALDAAILRLMTSGEYSSTNFNGQSFSYADLTRLQQMRVTLQAEVRRQQQAIDRLRGGRDPGRILTRFAPQGWCGPWPFNGALYGNPNLTGGGAC